MIQKLRVLLLAGAAAAPIAATAHAQATGGVVAGQGGEEDVIVVTGARRTQNLQDAALAISVADPEDYISRGLTSIENIIDYIPGVNYNDTGNPAQGQITIRGVSQESLIPVTAIYVDEVPITTSTPFAFGAQLLLDGLLGDIERVEVVRGPQGTLYGAGAMGGVVKYVTRDPSLDGLRGQVSADVSTIKDGGVSQLYRGVVSTPIVKDRIGLTVSGFYKDQAGFIDRLDPATLEVAEEDFNTGETYGFSAALLAEFTDAASLKITGMHQTTDVAGTSEVLFSAADPDNPVLVPVSGRLEFASPAAGLLDLSYNKLDATFKYDFGWAELTSVSAYAQYESLAEVEQAATLGPFVDFITGSAPGTTQSVPGIVDLESEKFVQELRLASPNNQTFEWQLGLFYVNEDTANTQDFRALPQNIELNVSDFPAIYEEFAFFGNATYYLTENFDVTAGIRVSDNSIESTFDFRGLLTEENQQTNSTSATTTTYMFNARWRVEDNLSLYASAASGFRPAFVNIPVTDAVTGQSASTVVDSDSLWSYEIGAKGSLFDGSLRYNTAFWYTDWDDFQASLTLNGLGTGGNSDASIESYGFELDFQASVTDSFVLEGSVAHTQSELTEDSLGLGALEGEDTRFLPNWTASFRANYGFDIGAITANAGVGLRYVGEYNTTYVGGFSEQFGQVVGAGNVQFPIEDYVLADLNTSFTWDRVTLNVYATNVFNRYAFGSGTASVAGNVFTATGVVLQPRTIGASVALSF